MSVQLAMMYEGKKHVCNQSDSVDYWLHHQPQLCATSFIQIIAKLKNRNKCKISHEQGDGSILIAPNNHLKRPK